MRKKQKTDKDTITVYWGAKTVPQRQTFVNLLWGPPVLLSKTLPLGRADGRVGNYRSCIALTNMIQNTYAFIHPLSHSVTISGEDGNLTLDAELDVWLKREMPLQNRYGIDYDFGWLFFSEESLKIRVTHPYFHNTSAGKTAFLSSGSFDIGKWFRMISMSYILWEGHNTITVTAEEPALYIEFLTDKKVILKQFECTPELNEISTQVVDASNLGMGKKSLEYRYDKFFKANRHKRVLKLIKENLLD